MLTETQTHSHVSYVDVSTSKGNVMHCAAGACHVPVHVLGGTLLSGAVRLLALLGSFLGLFASHS